MIRLALLLVVLASPALAFEDADEFQANFGMGMSKRIILGLEKACPFVREEMAKAEPEALTLLLSDEHAVHLYSGACVGRCSLPQIALLVTSCQLATGQRDCRPFGAIHDGKIYDLSVDPYGGSLARCLSSK